MLFSKKRLRFLNRRGTQRQGLGNSDNSDVFHCEVSTSTEANTQLDHQAGGNQLPPQKLPSPQQPPPLTVPSRSISWNILLYSGEDVNDEFRRVFDEILKFYGEMVGERRRLLEEKKIKEVKSPLLQRLRRLILSRRSKKRAERRVKEAENFLSEITRIFTSLQSEIDSLVENNAQTMRNIKITNLENSQMVAEISRLERLVKRNKRLLREEQEKAEDLESDRKASEGMAEDAHRELFEQQLESEQLAEQITQLEEDRRKYQVAQEIVKRGEEEMVQSNRHLESELADLQSAHDEGEGILEEERAEFQRLLQEKRDLEEQVASMMAKKKERVTPPIARVKPFVIAPATFITPAAPAFENVEMAETGAAAATTLVGAMPSSTYHLLPPSSLWSTTISPLSSNPVSTDGLPPLHPWITTTTFPPLLANLSDVTFPPSDPWTNDD